MKPYVVQMLVANITHIMYIVVHTLNIILQHIIFLIIKGN